MVEEAVLSEDQAIFYKFLKEFTSLDPLEAHVVAVADISAFFADVICDDKNNFQQLPFEGMEAIESLLISVNKSFGCIGDINRIKHHKHPIADGVNDEIVEVASIEFKV